MGYIAETRVTANLIALTGQSNAIGFYPDVALPAGYEEYQKDIFINFYDFTLSEFQRMHADANCGYDNILDDGDGGWGCEQSAAHALLASGGIDVALVKSGWSGGGIVQWAAGEDAYVELEGGLLAALNHTDRQMYFYNFNVISLLWIQGETDAYLGTNPATYEAALRDFISRIRASHAALANMKIIILTMPAIMTGTPEYYNITEENRNGINGAYVNIAADTANVEIINADEIVGLEMRDDNLHYTAASLLLIGNEWFNRMI